MEDGLKGVVLVGLLALAACTSPGEEAARDACAGGNAGACQAVAAADARRAQAFAAGLGSMSQAHYNAAAAYQPAPTMTCRTIPGPNVGSAPRGMTCY